MVSTKEFDELQARVLKELLLDGRKNFLDLSKKLDEPKEAVSRAYQEMVETGIINGATIHVNYRMFGHKAVANILINIEPRYADQLVKFIRGIPEIYNVLNAGIKGNVRVTTTFKTLHELDEIKDKIKLQFPVKSLKTIIWTDVKEMHSNLSFGAPKNNAAEENTDKNVGKLKSNGTEKKTLALDEIDLKITDKLAENGRVPFRKIAEDIGISTNKVKKRYEKLNKNGVLKVTIQMDATKIGYHTLAVFYVCTAAQKKFPLIIEKIGLIPDVISIMKTSGDYDLLVFVMIKDIEQLVTVQEEMSKIEGITEINMEISRMPNKWPLPRQYLSTF